MQRRERIPDFVSCSQTQLSSERETNVRSDDTSISSCKADTDVEKRPLRDTVKLERGDTGP